MQENFNQFDYTNVDNYKSFKIYENNRGNS